MTYKKNNLYANNPQRPKLLSQVISQFIRGIPEKSKEKCVIMLNDEEQKFPKDKGIMEQEEYLVEMYGNMLEAEVYKAGHHGSAGSSIQTLVDAVTPLHTVFSAGDDNSFGHPSTRIIRRVERVGSEVWRTDTMGDILMAVKNGEIEINGTPFYVDRETTSTTQRSSK